MRDRLVTRSTGREQIRKVAVAWVMAVTALVVPAGASVVLAAPAVAPEPVPAGDVWTVVDLPVARPSGLTLNSAPPIDIHTTAQVALILDAAGLAEQLAAAPMETVGQTSRAAAKLASMTIELPAPDGTMNRFSIVESPIMAPGVAAEFPEITTYAGVGIDDPLATIRLDQTPAGFHAQVLSPNGAWYIDPYFHLNNSIYVSYRGSDLVDTQGGFVETIDSGAQNTPSLTQLSARSASAIAGRSTGGTLRTYRLALAGTAEYTAFFGGTSSGGFAAAVTAVNRINGIYETELAVRLQLVTDQSLFFTDTATDGYTNSNGVAMLSQNQSRMDTDVGAANYDVGHVFSTGGGGVAGLGVVGSDSYKALGVTGRPNPVGDAFYVDYVAHELGHQFGANHTFNSDQGDCTGNGEPTTAAEPGSGTSIMAYAGICSTDDLQPNSDPYFHPVSYDEIQSYLDTVPLIGSSSSTGNSVPTVSVVGGTSFTIPIRTPFALNATASDANVADVVTFDWEQMDVGTLQVLSTEPKPTGALFRSQVPTTSGERWFPKRATVLAGNTTATTGSCPTPVNVNCLAEYLPTGARTMTFRAVVRDNRAGGGGINNSSTVTVNAVGTTPFRVTSQSTSASFDGGSSPVVTWDVAGTNAGSVNTPNVDILVSTDGGTTFSVVANATPNDGSEAIVLPSVSTTTARIMVRGHGNVFFDLNDADLTINAVVPGAATGLVATPGNTQVALSWTAPSSNGGSPITDYVIDYGPTAGGGFTVFDDGVSTATTATVNVGLTNGTDYTFRVRAKNALGPSSTAATVTATPRTVPGAPGTPAGVAEDGQVTLSWAAPSLDGGSSITDYLIGYRPFGSAPFVDFDNGVSAATSATVTGLTNDTAYEFRVAAVNAAGFGPNSPTSLTVTPTKSLPAVVAVTPVRVFDTRPDSPQGAVSVVQQQYGGAGNILKVKIAGAAGVPASGAGAVSLNVTVAFPDGAGFVTVFPCGERPLVASLNYVAGQIVPNAVIAPLSDAGEVCFFSQANTHLIADVNGWLPTGGGFTAVAPTREFDTRIGEPQGAISVGKQQYGGAGNILRVKVTGVAGVPATGVAAVSLNVTVANPVAAGFVTVFPCDKPRPLAANLNYVADQIVPNAVIAPVSADGEVCFFSMVNTDLIADVNGLFTQGSSFNALTPVRVFETRPDEPQGAVSVVQQKYGGAGNILKVKVAGVAGVPTGGVNAVSLNVTAVTPDGPGFVTVFPCDKPQPLTANLNYVAGQIVPNAVIAPVSADGEVCLFSMVNTHLIADVNAWFAS